MASLYKLSDKRGIYAAYDGNKYTIISTYYGVVAESTDIKRDENGENKSVVITFDICEWYGYWSLKDVINRGIKRCEQEFVKKDVQIIYNTVKGTENHLNKWWKIATEAY